MDSPVISVRAARAADAAAIAAIYNEWIVERVATFETRPRSAGDVEEWLAGQLPFLVAVDGADRVLGWARLTDYSDRSVYSGVAEHGVYVAAAARGRGLGRRLLEALSVQAAENGLYKLTSRVFADNHASRAAHRAAGFEEVGIQRRHGRLDGEWKDCVLVERLVGEAADRRHECRLDPS
jgi:L-amino acid N-acyltransferase YncA